MQQRPPLRDMSLAVRDYVLLIEGRNAEMLTALEEITNEFAYSKEVQRCFGDALERLTRYRALIAKATLPR